MIDAKSGRECGVSVVAVGSVQDIVSDVLVIIQAIHSDMSRLSFGELKAELFRRAVVAGLSPDSPVWRPCQGDVTSVAASGAAADALARAFEGGRQHDGD